MYKMKQRKIETEIKKYFLKTNDRKGTVFFKGDSPMLHTATLPRGTGLIIAHFSVVHDKNIINAALITSQIHKEIRQR